MKYIVQGRTRHDYGYAIKDEFRTLEDARVWRDKFRRGEVTTSDGHAYDGTSTLSIASYEHRSYEATFVE